MYYLFITFKSEEKNQSLLVVSIRRSLTINGGNYNSLIDEGKEENRRGN